MYVFIMFSGMQESFESRDHVLGVYRLGFRVRNARGFSSLKSASALGTPTVHMQKIYQNDTKSMTNTVEATP